MCKFQSSNQYLHEKYLLGLIIFVIIWMHVLCDFNANW